MTALLEISDAVAGYGKTQILNSVSFEVAAGGCVGICGPNGHGKTTLLRAVSGLLRLAGGDIMFDGRSIAKASPQAIVELGLIQVPQGNRLFPELSVAENLHLAAFSSRARAREAEMLDEVYALFPKLKLRYRQKCRTLSGGERQMLAVAVGLMASPRLLILDEPNLGLAPIIKEELGRAIQEVARRDITLIVVEQDIEFLMQVSERLLIMEHGEITADTDVTGPMTVEDVLTRYFGETP